MRQVPKYLIIGNGRVAWHLKHYLKLLNLPCQNWSRDNNTRDELMSFVKDCSHVLLLISDDAIEDFINDNDCLLGAEYLIHCSGSLTLENCFAAHPLMTFGPDLYDKKIYLDMPFILEEGVPDFPVLLPNLPNKSFKIPKNMKPLYHALCVIGGNFTCLLWQKFFSELENKFNLPKEIVYPYLDQVVKNLKNSATNALTGPLARDDKETIEANLKSLAGDPYQKIYQAFVEAYYEGT
jgi:predicted short-subunit dehydrogenase-like oxidoreductase (DUF2520 family)